MFLGSRSPICTPVWHTEIATELVYEYWATSFNVLRSMQSFGLTDGLNRTEAVPVLYPAIPQPYKRALGWLKSNRIEFHGKLVTTECCGESGYYGSETYDGETWEYLGSMYNMKYVDHFGDVYLFQGIGDSATTWLLFNYRTREIEFKARRHGPYMISEYDSTMVPFKPEMLGMQNPRFKVFVFDEKMLSVMRIEDRQQQVSFFRRLNLKAKPFNAQKYKFGSNEAINVWHVHGSWVYCGNVKFDLNETSKKSILLLRKKLPAVLLRHLYSFLAILII